MKYKLRSRLRNIKAKLALTDQKRSLLSNLPAFKETDIMSGEKEFCSSAWAIKQLEPLRGNLSRQNPPGFVLLSHSRNYTRNYVSIPPGKIKLAMKGLLVPLAGAMTASMNQIWLTHQQAEPTEWRFCSLFVVTTVHSALHISQLWGQFTMAFIKEGD